jgi:hypothetical protein
MTSMSRDVWLSLMAMDTYNRTNGSSPQFLEVNSVALGLYTIGISDEDIATGFFAQSYEINDDVVISYRGSDTLGFPPTADMHSWLWPAP